MFVALPSGKEIRSLPNSLKGMKLVLCDFRPNCKRPICTHPHSEDEMDIWAWMIKNNGESSCFKKENYEKKLVQVKLIVNALIIIMSYHSISQ